MVHAHLNILIALLYLIWSKADRDHAQEIKLQIMHVYKSDKYKYTHA